MGAVDLVHTCSDLGSRAGSENLLSPCSQDNQNPKTQLACSHLL